MADQPVYEKPVGVIVTAHAVERLIERFPDDIRPGQDAVALIKYEVHQALRDGRRATKLPRWTSPRGTRSRQSGGTYRFVWNQDETRCYPIKQQDGLKVERRGEFSDSWIVMTTLPRITEEEVETAKQIAKARKQGWQQRRKGKRR